MRLIGLVYGQCCPVWDEIGSGTFPGKYQVYAMIAEQPKNEDD